MQKLAQSWLVLQTFPDRPSTWAWTRFWARFPILLFSLAGGVSPTAGTAAIRCWFPSSSR